MEKFVLEFQVISWNRDADLAKLEKFIALLKMQLQVLRRVGFGRWEIGWDLMACNIDLRTNSFRKESPLF
jgi:hypothetical protein